MKRLPLLPTLEPLLLQLDSCLYPLHIATFKFTSLPSPFLVFLVSFSLLRFIAPVSPPPPPRRTCQTGLLRPRWTPALRPGLLGHFLDFDSPAELLREQGALLTFRVPGPPGNILGLAPLFPADLLRENGHIFIFNSAEELAPL